MWQAITPWGNSGGFSFYVATMPLVVLVAPAAFKGTLGPRQVAEAIAAGVRRAVPDATVLECPVADGGNGLLDVILPAGALRERLDVTGPIGESVSAELGWIDGETAIIESASACGLALVEPEDRDPMRTTTRGVGELIWTAADRGAKTIVVGLGGTATVDGGTGAARGFGWTFENAAGEPLPDGGGSLEELASFGSGWALAARVVALADVATPLLGPDGAAPVFGPQKGARPEEIPRLAAGLTRLSELWAQAGRPELGTVPMGGAAGGLGAGLAFFAKAELAGGAQWCWNAPASTRPWQRPTWSSPPRAFSTRHHWWERRRAKSCAARKRPGRRLPWSRDGSKE